MSDLIEHRLAVVKAAALHASNRAMVWGVDDCGLFAAGVIETIAGVDLGKGIRFQYGSPEAAARMLGPGGVPLRVRRLMRRAGFRRIPVGDAWPGDLGLIRTVRGAACVVRYEPGWWIGRGDDGVTFSRDGAVRLAWGVR